MAQQAFTTNDLIVNSLYLIGELAVGETPDAFMLTTGLELLNELLDKFAADSIFIPYLTEINFNFTVGKGTYSISDMISADITQDQFIDLSFATYTLPPADNNSITYPLRIISKEEYYNVGRQTHLLTRPAVIFMNKQALETFITVYPIPDQPYPCSLFVKCFLNKFTQQDVLGTQLPPNSYGFLKYAMARKFMAYYPSGNWPQTNEDEYQDYYRLFKGTNETDLTIRQSAIMANVDGFYWQLILTY